MKKDGKIKRCAVYSNYNRFLINILQASNCNERPFRTAHLLFSDFRAFYPIPCQ